MTNPQTKEIYGEKADDQTPHINILVEALGHNVYQFVNKGKKDIIVFWEVKRFKNGNIKIKDSFFIPSKTYKIFDGNIYTPPAKIDLDELMYRVKK